MREFFLVNNVTWLESTIACPLFSGLITYYIEGAQSERHHLMMEKAAQPRLSYGVRGNIFSFLMDWEQTQCHLSKILKEGDVWDWPMDRRRASQIVRIRIVKGQESIIEKFKELKVRAEIVRQIAYLYIADHMEELLSLEGAQKIHRKMQQATVQLSLQAHVDSRIQEHFPPSDFPSPDGAVLPEFYEMVREADDLSNNNKHRPRFESAFDNKQSTMPDAESADINEVFRSVRPNLVVAESSVDNVLSQNLQTEFALSQVAGTTIEMSNKFVDQFVSRYLSSIFPWSLNYACGGPEYPALFNVQAWSDMEMGSTDVVQLGIEKRWRRLQAAPVVTPGLHAQHLATRSEAQVASDWMVVPAARNLHWRYSVLHKAFVTCKEKLAAGESLTVNLQQLVDASTSLLERLHKGSVIINKKPKPINGDMAMLFKADDLKPGEKLLLRCYFNITQSIAGCQAIRRRIGHCLFGFRVVYGECIFVTVSPNRRWSRLLMRMSRIRRNDPMANASMRRDRDHVDKRFYHADASTPSLYTEIDDERDLEYLFTEYADMSFAEQEKSRQNVERIFLELQMPSLTAKQAWNAEDPLASVHNYLVNMKVHLPLLYGIRMCFHCPACNVDEYDDTASAILGAHSVLRSSSGGCQNNFGSNATLAGGFAGLAQGLAFANEFQGDGTPHGHGFVSLANAYQHSTLQDIAECIEANADFLHRLMKFNEHLQTEEHMDHEAHQRNIDTLQRSFHKNHSDVKDILMLGLQLPENGKSARAPFLWSGNNDVMKIIQAGEEAKMYKAEYEREVQRVFSRVQHHWHSKDEKGNDVPMKYCRIRSKIKHGCNCKMGFPRHVPFVNGVIQKDKYKSRVVCPGIAQSVGLRCSGRRNALGSIIGKRLDPWFSATSAIKAKVFKSNTNVQMPYRVPITERTHDSACKSQKCLSMKIRRRQFLVGQRAVKQMIGYFGGYISKKQKLGRFELKQSIASQPFLFNKLIKKEQISAGNQLAHVCNRLFTNLEGKGILRSGVEECMLASEYSPSDELSAEFIRTFRHNFFFGRYYLERYDKVHEKEDPTIDKCLPKNLNKKGCMDTVSLYGLRCTDPRLYYMSPWEFVQWWAPVHTRAPSKNYKYTVWLPDADKERAEPGLDYKVRFDKFVHKDIYTFPPRIEAGPLYERFRNTWFLRRRLTPVVPCSDVALYIFIAALSS